MSPRLAPLCISLAVLGISPAAVAGDPGFSMTLKPVAGADGKVLGIDVSQSVTAQATSDGQPLSFAAAVVFNRVEKVADRVTDLRVVDAHGEVPLTISQDERDQGGFPYYRHYRVTRPVAYPVKVSYRALVRPPGGASGPPHDLRPAGEGLAGSGGAFLLLPENAKSEQSRLRWDLSGLPRGSVAATTFGDGDVTVDGAPRALAQAWYVAGPAKVKRDRVRNFAAYLLGAPPFDAEAELQWSVDAYAYIVKFFGYDPKPPPFRVFMRVLDAPPYSSGSTIGHSFLLSMGKQPRTDGQPTRRIVFHEALHPWTGKITAANDAGSWFSEGLTTHYTSTLPFRAGLGSLEEMLYDINFDSRAYYKSAYRNWSAARIRPLGYENEGARATPYHRGALYFAELDRQIREHSGGKRNLDAFLRPLFADRHAGKPFDDKVWAAALQKELGPQAVADWRAINIEGDKTITPGPDAYGPCVERQEYQLKADDGEMVTAYRWIARPAADLAACRAH